VTADPLSGDPAEIRRVAQAYSTRARSVATGSDSVKSAVDEAASAWRGKSKDAFVSTAAQMRPTATRIVERLEAAAAALHSYAAELHQIQDEAHRMQTARLNARRDAASNARAVDRASRAAQGSDATDGDRSHLLQLQNGGASLASLQSRLEAQWRDLESRRAAADQRVATALTAPAVLGRTATAAAVQAMSDGQLLRYLSGLDRESINVIAVDESLRERLAAVKDPERVARWWSELEQAARAAFVRSLPTVIGNLEGITYADRSSANAIALPMYLDEARAQVDKWEALAAAAPTEAVRAAYSTKADAWRDRLDGYKAIADALKVNGVSLLSLVPDRPPLAQLAVGQVDTAEHVSYVVPGMNTATNGDTTVDDYVRAIIGLQATQRRVGGVAPEDVAVVAWIGYHPPMQDLSAPTVMYNDRARAGAENLVQTLDGFHAVRGELGRSADVSVVAHSYGTDVATLALTRAHADHAVLLGSAGVVGADVPDVGALNVPKGQVFATQAEHDAWAVTGQHLSGRLDPTEPSWGAHDFSSEQTEADGQNLQATNKHGPFGDGGDVFSYLDNRTTSQYRAAQATMGLGTDIPEWGNPADRSSDLANKNEWGMWAWQNGAGPLLGGDIPRMGTDGALR